ncbi:MAG: RNA polymerase factor sigma-54 [bacterium]
MADHSMSMSQVQRMQMVLAPQLRQSLEMLQLPVMELQTLIRQELEKNPTLEEVPEATPEMEIAQPSGEERADPPAVQDNTAMDFTKDFETLARLDQEWRDYFFQEESKRSYSSEQADKRQFFMDSMPQRESLQEHLMKQLELTALSEEDRQVGELIVGSINDDGYLTSSIEELSETVAIEAAHMHDVLTVIQDFNPTGVGARNLKECLQIQMDRLGKTDTLAYQLVAEHLESLAAHKFPDIARALKVTSEEVQAAANFIATLDPKPGRAYSTDVPDYVMPEVAVMKTDEGYAVVLNDENLPHLRISNHYRQIMEDKSTSADVKEYIVQKVRSGVFMIKSIQQRQQTLYKIATEIVKTQTAFLNEGLAHLKPLTMAQVATIVGVHETTVSRAVSGKYMQTPVGVFEMKYFFAPGFRTEEGKDISNKSVQDMIAKFVAEEDRSHPLSDQELVGKLRVQGISIARRTVTKYRIVLRLGPSHMRKSYQ